MCPWTSYSSTHIHFETSNPSHTNRQIDLSYLPASLALCSNVGFWQSEVVREMERKWHRAYFHKSLLLACSAVVRLSATCLLSLTIRHSCSAKYTATSLSQGRRKDKRKCQLTNTKTCVNIDKGARSNFFKKGKKYIKIKNKTHVA